MPFSGIIDPNHLTMLTQVLDDYCYPRGIDSDAERESVATRLVNLFQAGVQTPDELTSALASYSDRESRRKA